MIIELKGEQDIAAPAKLVWERLMNPEFLTRCIPGCKAMELIDTDQYRVTLELKVASVGGSFEGHMSLTDKRPPSACQMSVSGSGSLGHGHIQAELAIHGRDDGTCRLDYHGVGEVGGLVAGVGQRILQSTSKYLVGQFFKAARSQIAAECADPA